MSYFRAENLSLHFGGLKAVDAVSFAVEKGEILSIIGPNGAGKSSIFNLISRIYRPTWLWKIWPTSQKRSRT